MHLAIGKYTELDCFQYNALFQLLTNQAGYCCIHFTEKEIETQCQRLYQAVASPGTNIF
jgi:hypothetical protein